MSTVITNPETLKQLEKAIEEISVSMHRIAAERDLIKNIVDDLAEDHKLDKGIIKSMAKIHHKQNFNKVIEKNEELEVLYSNIMNRNKQ